MRRISPTVFEVKQKNWGNCMCLVCFLAVSKMKLPCVHSWESCTTSRDCYLAITLVLHRYTLSQLSTSIFQSYWCFLESKRFGSTHTDYPYSICIASQFCIIFTVLGADTLPAYSFHIWKQYLSPKTFSSALYWKELNSPKNYFKKKINLAVKPWWQWTGNQVLGLEIAVVLSWYLQILAYEILWQL